MNAQPYDQLSDLTLLELCTWREAQNQGSEGMRAVAWSIRNRVGQPCWWGKDWHTVILKPYQYSSFNPSDPNSRKWPADNDVAFAVCCEVAMPVYLGRDTNDLTHGATHYFDTSIEFPKAWGNPDEWINTLNIRELRFYKLKPPLPQTHLDIQGDV